MFFLPKPKEPATTTAPAKMNWPRVFKEYPFIAAANVAIASILTLTHATKGDFLENLVFSFCIGTLVSLLIHFGVWQMQKYRIQITAGRMGWVAFIACVLGISIGLGLGSVILGIPGYLLAINFFKQSNTYVVLLLMMCLVTLIIFWIRNKMERLRAHIAQEKLRAEENARRSLQAQLQLLQAQIEPHMLFNTLANVQGLISFDPPRAAVMLDHLILFLRASLQVARAEQTTLKAEFHLMQAYLDLMAIRMGSRLSFTLALPEELSALAIAPMLLQPLIENAIKHGVEPKIEGGHIAVKAWQQDGFLHLSVTDSGLGLDAPAQPGTRLGVTNIRERLFALYGEHANLTLGPNLPQGTLAEMRIPLSSLD